MKLKKIIAAAASVVMACVFATSAFAAPTTAAQKQKIIDAAAQYGYTITASQIGDDVADKVAAAGGATAVEAQVNSYVAQAKADPSKAASIAATAANYVSGMGIAVQVADVEVVNVQIKAKVTVAGQVQEVAVKTEESKKTADEHPEIGAAIANGTWGDNTANAAAATSSNPLVASNGSVIKATGDNSAMILVVSVLAVAGILGMAVRKNNEV